MTFDLKYSDIKAVSLKFGPELLSQSEKLIETALNDSHALDHDESVANKIRTYAASFCNVRKPPKHIIEEDLLACYDLGRSLMLTNTALGGVLASFTNAFTKPAPKVISTASYWPVVQRLFEDLDSEDQFTACIQFDNNRYATLEINKFFFAWIDYFNFRYRCADVLARQHLQHDSHKKLPIICAHLAAYSTLRSYIILCLGVDARYGALVTKTKVAELGIPDDFPWWEFTEEAVFKKIIAGVKSDVYETYKNDDTDKHRTPPDSALTAIGELPTEIYSYLQKSRNNGSFYAKSKEQALNSVMKSIRLRAAGHIKDETRKVRTDQAQRMVDQGEFSDDYNDTCLWTKEYMLKRLDMPRSTYDYYVRKKVLPKATNKLFNLDYLDQCNDILNNRLSLSEAARRLSNKVDIESEACRKRLRYYKKSNQLDITPDAEFLTEKSIEIAKDLMQSS